MKTAVPVPCRRRDCSTVTSWASVGAAPGIVMFAVSVVALDHVVEFTVMPVPENDATAPLTKLAPLMVTFRFVAP